MNSAIYGLKMMQYEFGPDVTGSPPNGPGPVVGKQKLDTLFDPLFKPTYRVLLDNIESAGFEEVACYNAGTCPVGSTNEYSSWGIFRDYDSSGSVRSDVISEKLAAPRTGPTRNLLAPTGTTVIDPHQILGVYVNTGNHPGLINDWVVTAPRPTIGRSRRHSIRRRRPPRSCSSMAFRWGPSIRFRQATRGLRPGSST
jgi:hypothetical protein